MSHITMLSAVNILYTTITIMQGGMGIILNTCIVSFSFENLKNGLSFNPTNLIYFTMGLVNIFMQLVFTAEAFILVFWPSLYCNAQILLALVVMTTTVMYSSFWLTGWLCAHFCVSISSFSHRLIVGLKWFLSSFLLHVLLLSIIGPFFMSILIFWIADIEFPIPKTTNSTLVVIPLVVTNPAYRVMTTLLGCCIPFILALISTGVTVSSLIRHINKMKANISGYTPPNLQALINATRTMVLLLTFSVIVYIIELLFLGWVNSIAANAKVIISWYIIMSFSSAEAVIIIQAIPRLRKMILGKFCPGKEGSNEMEVHT